MTTLLTAKDPKYSSPKADAARVKEVQSLEARKWVNWETLTTLDDFEDQQMPGTWSPAQMLTSEMHCELNLPYEECLLKGRLVHSGCHEYNYKREDIIEERRKILLDKNMHVKPINGTELRGVLALEVALALEGGYVPSLRIGDELQAYTRTPRGDDITERRWILFRRSQLGWLPEHIRAKAERLLDRCPRGIVVELAVYLYGDLASGFYYELRRNNDFHAEGAAVAAVAARSCNHEAKLTSHDCPAFWLHELHEKIRNLKAAS